MIRPWTSPKKSGGSLRWSQGGPRDGSSGTTFDTKGLIDAISKFLPIAAAGSAAIGIAYDVGFFDGIDIKLFTIFSISEHILFSLETMPYTLACLMFTLIFSRVLVMVARHGDYKHTVATGRKAGLLYARFERVVLINSGFISCGVVFLIYMDVYSLAYGVTFILANMLLVLVLKELNNVVIAKLSLGGALVRVGVGLYIVLFPTYYIMGHDDGASYVKKASKDDIIATHRIMTVKGGNIEGRIIRTGDRGVLVLDVEDNNVKFIKWDVVDKIISIHKVGRITGTLSPTPPASPVAQSAAPPVTPPKVDGAR
jgi:hypothetical protein